MTQWLVIDSATQNIIGWTRSGKAKELPPAPEGRTFVEATDEMIQTLEDARTAGAARGAQPIMTARGIELPPDTRPRISIQADKESVVAGSEDVVLTATSVGDRFTGSRVIEGFGGRLLRFDFVNGVATKTIRMDRSGKFELASTKDVRIETKVEVTAVE